MRFILPLIIQLLLASPHFANAVDESTEPPQEFAIDVSGKSYSVTPGKPLALKGAYTDPVLRLTIGTKRRFEYGGISFEYPASFTWEADLTTPGIKQWTLSGNSLAVIYSRYENKVSLDEFVEATSKSYQKTIPVKITSVKRMLGGKELQGKAIHVNFGEDVSVVQEVYDFESPKGSKIIILQDSYTGNSKHSEEFNQWITTITDTIKIQN